MRHWRDTLAITLGAGLVYALLRQDAVHHLDMHGVVRSVAAAEGEGARYGHFGYQWLALVLHWLLGADAPLYRALQWCSVVAAALAVGAGHRASLTIGLSRSSAAFAAVGAGATVPAMHFATVAEIHAVFWLPVNVMFWALASFVHRGGRLAAMLVGAASGVAAAVHSSGHLLPGIVLLACVAFGWRDSGTRARLAWGVLLVLVGHLLVFAALRVADAVCVGFADDAASRGFLAETFARWQGFSPLPGLTWREWLRPFAPFSGFVLLACLHRQLRPAACALLLAVVGYLAVDLALLIGLVEHGAYALPLALPAAALTARWLGTVGAAIAFAVALGVSVPHVLRQDPARIARSEFAAGLAEWALQHPGSTFLLGGFAEIDSMLVFGAPRWHHTIIEPQFFVWLEPATPNARVREEVVMAARTAARNGGALVFSAEAAALFRGLPRNVAILQGLANEFVVREVRQDGFAGVAIEPPR